MSTTPWALESHHPFKPAPDAPLMACFKCAILNLLFTADFHSDNPRSHAFNFFEPIEVETNEHTYFDEEEEVPEWVRERLLDGAKYMHVEVETRQTTDGKSVGRRTDPPKGKAIYEIQVRASIRNEKQQVGREKDSGYVYWSLTVQFDLRFDDPVCATIGSWSRVVRLLRDAVVGGFLEDGSPAGGKRRAVPHYMVDTMWITTDKTGLSGGVREFGFD